MANVETPKKKHKIGGIISTIACILIFLFVGYELAVKFSHNSIYLFGVRSDVVLTDSMSYKNEDPEVQSFLQGRNDQLQVGDLTYSVKIDEKTELNVYDKVMFIHPDTGKMTTHRIVAIDHTYAEPRYVIRADTANAASYDGAFPRKDLTAKVVGYVPWVGHIVNFLQSFWGILLLIGTAIIVIVYNVLIDLKFFKAKDKEAKS